MDQSLSMYTIKLQRNANRKSKVWDFFGILLLEKENKSVEEDKVFCKLCLEGQKKVDGSVIFSIFLFFLEPHNKSCFLYQNSN